jgi:hypothetical protein
VWFLLVWPVGLYYLVRRLGGAKALAVALPVVAVFLFIGALASIGSTSSPAVTAAPATLTVVQTVEQAAADPVPVEAPAESAGQENARRTAEDYVSTAAFSRVGLIKQLKFEGYSTADASYGVDAINADWNEQAAKSAKDYLDVSGFSRSGLIGQLEFDGYTAQQAAYGVSRNGL